uniref:Uncharacterized protein n=1 Tax=Caenorhabditis japonica TaxID=281687 RepID=A0A8R1DLZ6_CAEJA
MSDTFDWIQERIHNKSHFSARYVGQLADVSGMDPNTVSIILSGFFFLILTFTDQAHFFANCLLIGVPLLLIFVYPEEKPNDESFYVYFPIFGGVTIFDRGFENIPCYYVFKVTLFLLFFAPPYVLNQQIVGLFKQQLVETSQRSRSKSSPKSVPSSTKTALSIQKTMSPTPENSTKTGRTPSLRTAVLNSAMSDVKVTIIEEYYREEELLSPNGTVIDRTVTGPFRKESYRMESKSAVKSPI